MGVWVCVPLGGPERKINQILADVFLLQFSPSEPVDGNAARKAKGSASQTAAVFKLQP